MFNVRQYKNEKKNKLQRLCQTMSNAVAPSFLLFMKIQLMYNIPFLIRKSRNNLMLSRKSLTYFNTKNWN